MDRQHEQREDHGADRQKQSSQCLRPLEVRRVAAWARITQHPAYEGDLDKERDNGDEDRREDPPPTPVPLTPPAAVPIAARRERSGPVVAGRCAPLVAPRAAVPISESGLVVWVTVEPRLQSHVSIIGRPASMY